MPAEISINATSLPVYRITKQLLQKEGYVLGTDAVGSYVTARTSQEVSDYYEIEFLDQDGKTKLRTSRWTKKPGPFAFAFDSGEQRLSVPTGFRTLLEKIKSQAEIETRENSRGRF